MSEEQKPGQSRYGNILINTGTKPQKNVGGMYDSTIEATSRGLDKANLRSESIAEEKRTLSNKMLGTEMQVKLDFESGFKFGLGFGCASIVIVLLTWVFVATVGAGIVRSFLLSIGW